jgi:hypothetical protein
MDIKLVNSIAAKDARAVKKKWGRQKVKVSQRFVTALSVVSILGFIGIVSETLFGVDLKFYVEALLMFVIGIGLVIEVKWSELKTVRNGLDRENFTDITTVVIGFVAIIAGIFSLPFFRFESPSFLAIKGIIAIIAIVIIVIQTWVSDRRVN